MARQTAITQHGQSMSRVAGACLANVEAKVLPLNHLSAYPTQSPEAIEAKNFDGVWNLSGKRPSRVALT